MIIYTMVKLPIYSLDGNRTKMKNMEARGIDANYFTIIKKANVQK